MREKVCIVLNERESTKAKAAEALETRLKAHNITTSRISVDKNVQEVILARNPSILVIDYLLGDYTTGLDILNRLKELPSDDRPRSIFFTDEPSVNVAAEAMRLGAIDFYEIENPQAVAKVATLIESELQSYPQPVEPKRISRLAELIANSPASRTMIEQATLAAQKASPIIVFRGDQGVGRSTMASATLLERTEKSYIKTIDLRYFDRQIEELFRSEKGFSFGSGRSIILEHANKYDSEILEFISRNHQTIWPNGDSLHSQSTLAITTDCEETSLGWTKLTPAIEVFLPTLSARKEDIPYLIRQFTSEAERLSAGKVKPLENSITSWMSTLPWPGGLRQLRATTIDAALSKNDNDSLNIKEFIESHLEIARAPQDTTSIKPLLAAHTLEQANNNMRIAAARLGCSVSTLKKILQPTEVQQ